MRMRLITATILLLLAACSGEPASPYAGLPQSVLYPPANVAQVVVYYPYSTLWSDDIADVGFDGKGTSCGLESGSFLVRNVTPSPHTTVIVSLCGMPGLSHVTIKTAAGMRYFIRVTPANTHTLAELIVRRSLEKPTKTILPWKALSAGPYAMDIMDAPAANAEIQKLKACKRCF